MLGPAPLLSPTTGHCGRRSWRRAPVSPSSSLWSGARRANTSATRLTNTARLSPPSTFLSSTGLNVSRIASVRGGVFIIMFSCRFADLHLWRGRDYSVLPGLGQSKCKHFLQNFSFVIEFVFLWQEVTFRWDRGNETLVGPTEEGEAGSELRIQIQTDTLGRQ